MRDGGNSQSHDGLDLMIRRGNNYQRLLGRGLGAGKEGKVGSKSMSPKWLDEWRRAWKPAEKNYPTARSIKAVYQRAFRPALFGSFWPVERAFILGTVAEQRFYWDHQGFAVELPVKLIFSIRESLPRPPFRVERVLPSLLRNKGYAWARWTWKRWKWSSRARGLWVI